MSQPPSHSGAPMRASEQLLRSARADHAPTSADRERVRRALARRLAHGADTLPDAAVRESSGLLHPLVKTGIGLVLLAAGITTLMRSNEPPKSVPVKRPQSSEVQPEVPTDDAQSPPPAAGVAVEPSVPAPELRALSPKRAAARPKAAPRAGQALEAARWPAAKSVSAIASESMVHDDAKAGTQPAASQVSPEHHAREAQPSPAADSAQARGRESKPAKAELERTETPTARAHDASADGREELMFLARVRAELNENEHEHVLELCDEHRLRWPRGIFTQEREGLRAIAMCESENVRAANHARAFFASYPQSPMAPRVRAACALQLKTAALQKSR